MTYKGFFGICIIFLLLILPLQLSACGWFFTLDQQGKEVVKGLGDEFSPHRSFSKSEGLKLLEELEKSLAHTYNYQKHSDYALWLSRIGKVEEALEIMQKLNQEHPNEYILMANLGTFYELNGKPKEALYWIQKAIEKNPKSHYGSEWIHVKILEAKLKIKEDPNWLKNHRVLDVDFSKYNAVPLDEETLVDLEELEQHLKYQLEERIPYTPSPDPIVYQLLMEMASLSSLNDLYGAYLAARFALVFANNPDEKAQTQAKIQESEALIAKFGKEAPNNDRYSTDGEILHLPDYKVKDFFPKEKPVLANDEKPSDSGFLLVFLIGIVLLIVLGLVAWRLGRKNI
ncbi:MAG: tetratricopeptide repeat protein [Microscillaceae bacterium]|nr:tetratricopeptide repeat protein [Microscillaceae bacterium]